MKIRTFQAGDEAAQAALYNEAAADLPKYKPATAEEVRRRVRAPGFDPGTRFYAEDAGQVVGYANFHPNGRVSFPWCKKGQEGCAGPLFQQVLEAMKARGISSAFAAYRKDWPAVLEFFTREGFRQTREMMNFAADETDMPTRPEKRANPLSPLRREDLPALTAMVQQLSRPPSAELLEQHLFHNSYFPPENVFVVRSRVDSQPLALAILVANPDYADPSQVDADMPCFRLGAFGTEGMTTKRLNGLFSFITREPKDVNPLGLDLMGHCAFRLEEKGGGTLAAQVPSDVPHLLRFYQRYFRRQGSFPILERAL